jgi:hypothetical protein
VGIALLAEVVRVPSLPFAVGLYLPVSTMVPVFLGGWLRWLMQRRGKSEDEKNERRERGVLFGSGLVGGEGLCGVAIAGVVFVQKWLAEDPTADQPLPLAIGTDWAARLAAGLNAPFVADAISSVSAAVVFGAVMVYFARRCRAKV